MDGAAFQRAKGYLDYAPKATRLAFLSGIAIAIVQFLLVLLAAVFTDLLVERGRIPAWFDLSGEEQAKVLADWKTLDEQKKKEALGDLGAGMDDFNRLAAGDDPKGETPRLNLLDRDILWRSYVRQWLKDQIGPNAANQYQKIRSNSEGLPSATELILSARQGHGILSLCVRLRDHWAGQFVNRLASTFPWTYTGETPDRANRACLAFLLILTGFLLLVRFVLLVALNRASGQAALEALTHLRRAIYLQSYRLGSSGLRQSGAGEANSMFTRHAETIHTALFAALTTWPRQHLTAGLLLATSLLLHTWLTMAFLAAGLLVWLFGGRAADVFRLSSRIAAQRSATRLALLQESIKIMRLVKCYLMESFNQARIERQLAEYAKAHDLRYRAEAVTLPLFGLIAFAACLVILFFGGLVVLNEGIGVGGFVVQMVALTALVFPIAGILAARRAIHRGTESAAIVFEFLARKGETATQGLDAEFLPPLSKSLEFRDVLLKEPGTGRLLLDNLELKIAARQRVCIIGTNENEVQALLSLIPRLVDPNDGRVLIDGVNLKQVTTDSLRIQQASVLQQQLIFNDTVANNIGCGDPSYNLPQVIEAAKVAHAHQFIQKLPAGYETPIGELGLSLKPIQQFQIALARAILRDPALLILEEPRLPLDPDSEALVDDTLSRFLPGRTAIFLPHRLSTLHAADRVIVLDRGRVVADGTHKELFTGNALYKHLIYSGFSIGTEKPGS